MPLVVKDSTAVGDQGKLTVTVDVDEDGNEANNSKTVDVVIAKGGADLRVIGLDVTQLDAKGKLSDKAIPPGGSSVAVGYIANHGHWLPPPSRCR